VPLLAQRQALLQGPHCKPLFREGIVDLVRWIEGKLEEHGIKKVVPDREVLESAYRRAFQAHRLEERLAEIAEEVHQEAQEAKLPANLRKKVREALKHNPEKSWDAVIAELVMEGS
jgi:hypothetical protein